MRPRGVHWLLLEASITRFIETKMGGINALDTLSRTSHTSKITTIRTTAKPPATREQLDKQRLRRRSSMAEMQSLKDDPKVRAIRKMSEARRASLDCARPAEGSAASDLGIDGRRASQEFSIWCGMKKPTWRNSIDLGTRSLSRALSTTQHSRRQLCRQLRHRGRCLSNRNELPC